jgi:hypothetical protein
MVIIIITLLGWLLFSLETALVYFGIVVFGTLIMSWLYAFSSVVMATNAFLVFAAALCFAGIADIPYGFYSLIRWVACGTAIASAIQMHAKHRTGWVWALGIIALIFNPLVPFYFPKSVWIVFDAAAGACFLTVFWQTRRDTHKT